MINHYNKKKKKKDSSKQQLSYHAHMHVVVDMTVQEPGARIDNFQAQQSEAGSQDKAIESVTTTAGNRNKKAGCRKRKAGNRRLILC